MKTIRSTKCSLKEMTTSKSSQLDNILNEYGKVVNIFIHYFWQNPTSKDRLLKNIVDLPETWLSARLRKVAAREAIDMISSAKEVLKSNKEQLHLTINALKNKIKNTTSDTKENRRKINNWNLKVKKLTSKLNQKQATEPKHKGNRMCVSCTIADLQHSKESSFDAWLHLSSIGNKVIFDLPIKFHKHYNKLAEMGRRLNSYIITREYVQLSFEIVTEGKKEVKTIIGIDTGINALASMSDGTQEGLDIKDCVNRIKRCKYGSKGKQRAINTLKQRICEVAKKVVNKADLLVVEQLSNMNNNSKLKGRLSKNIRSSIGNWNYAYWLERLEQECEINRVSFRTVSPYYTSQKCRQCGHVDRMNRVGEIFECQSCGYSGNADIYAASNIRERFITGKYGSCYKHLML